ncbi:unnamed protein product [Adineta ricciae]|uniref:G-protein coupled receptors family 1 profile domain-containing protein n=1 Tax=Adineta ricciae TaxID=249248 RepID=A0A813WY02_ADIRI|nr:unnamed protein product [Adineta ricciae]
MSATIISTFNHATSYSNIGGGFFIFLAGMIGNILNIIVFTSLKTFRQTSAAFYMTSASFVNIFQLVVGLLSRILITGYNIDPTKTSSFICKTRQFTLITTMLMAFSCMCLAAIDQYLSLTQRWRHLCTVKAASRFIIGFFVAWILHGITLFIYSDVISTEATGQTTCGLLNTGFSTYYSRFLFPVLLGVLPLIIRVFFGILAFVTVKRLSKREVPVVRLERDKQLTTMVLVEVAVDVVLTLPYSIYNYWYSSSVTFNDGVSSAVNQFIIALTRVVFYGNFAVAFYIYYCVSSRFRKQLAYVLVQMHLKYWREKGNQTRNNQIVPESVRIDELQ